MNNSSDTQREGHSQSQNKFSDPSTIPYSFFQKLPKAELHLHLDGSIPVSTIIELAREQNVKLPTWDLAELTKMITVDENCPSLIEYLRGFAITHEVTQEAYAITRGMFEVCAAAAVDGVRYLEVRFAPSLHTRKLSLSSVISAVIEGKIMAETRYSIVVRIIVIGMRNDPPTKTLAAAEIAWRYREHVSGFDIAGPEQQYSSRSHKPAFDLARKQLINVTIHSGESAEKPEEGYMSIFDSIRHCGATRIGHGVAMKDSPKLLKLVANRGIGIEVCLTSNQQTKAISRIEDHPLPFFFNKGIITILCTDNVVVSGVTLSQEYFKAYKLFKFSVRDIVKLVDYGFKSAFVEEALKTRLRAEAFFQAYTLFKTHGYDVSQIDNDLYFIPINVYTIVTSKFPRYYDAHQNPSLSSHISLSLPKADVHCRLSFQSLSSLWVAICRLVCIKKDFASVEELDPNIFTKRVEEFLGIRLSSLDEFFNLIQNNASSAMGLKVYKHLLSLIPTHVTEHESLDSDTTVDKTTVTPARLCRLIGHMTLQAPLLIRHAVRDVMMTAYRDGVVYLELVIRPSQHIHGIPHLSWLAASGTQTSSRTSTSWFHSKPVYRMTMDMVIQSVLDAKNEMEDFLFSKFKYVLNTAVVLGCHQTRDDPVVFKEVAIRCLKYREYRSRKPSLAAQSTKGNITSLQISPADTNDSIKSVLIPSTPRINLPPRTEDSKVSSSTNSLNSLSEIDDEPDAPNESTDISDISDIDHLAGMSIGGGTLDQLTTGSTVCDYCDVVYHLGVVGFCAFGGSFSPSSYWHFKQAFAFLKDNHINVCINAVEPTDVLAAVQIGGANRISNGARIHTNPELVSYLASRKIGLEQGLTEKFSNITVDIQQIAGNPIKLFIDAHLLVGVCSFRYHDTSFSRSEILSKISHDCNLDIAEVLSILRNSFIMAFAPSEVRKVMMNSFWHKSIEFLKSQGFNHFRKKTYFPSNEEIHLMNYQK